MHDSLSLSPCLSFRISGDSARAPLVLCASLQRLGGLGDGVQDLDAGSSHWWET